MLYIFCNTLINSQIALPELLRANTDKPECTLLVDQEIQHYPETFPLIHQWRAADGEPWRSLGKKGDEYLFRFPALADFHVSSAGSDIRCHAPQGTSLETIRHLFLDQVLPLVLSHRGRLVLHASAVATPEGVVAFVGESGRGKSTLAASFSQRGCQVLADDCLVLMENGGRLVAYPSYPGLRLWAGSIAALYPERDFQGSQVAEYSEKIRVDLKYGASGASEGPGALRRLYFLQAPREEGGPQGIEIAPLSQRDALMALVQSAFKLDIADKEVLQREFELFGRLVEQPIFFSLAYPRDFALLPKIHEAIASHLRV